MKEINYCKISTVLSSRRKRRRRKGSAVVWVLLLVLLTTVLQVVLLTSVLLVVLQTTVLLLVLLKILLKILRRAVASGRYQITDYHKSSLIYTRHLFDNKKILYSEYWDIWKRFVFSQKCNLNWMIRILLHISPFEMFNKFK